VPRAAPRHALPVRGHRRRAPSCCCRTTCCSTDSLIREAGHRHPRSDWEQVEIIGWLYQFYISEKKDQVIGKVVKSEDIPAATQLFTPNWIVQYLVQNSVGRSGWHGQPHSARWPSQMAYYIQPAEQTTRSRPNSTPDPDAPEDSLNPETITVLDPACGSGHILVEAYELFKAIYLERGYRQRDVPRLILEKNLFGLDIDDRAAQLAGFALLMKGRRMTGGCSMIAAIRVSPEGSTAGC
jgi:type II restriction/modification system DNA methylase subunit YeeA